VFDLDFCVWSPEMYELSHVPTDADIIRGSLGDGVGNGVVAVRSGSETIKIFPAALKVMQEYHAGLYPNMRIAAASSADTPKAVKIGRAAMALLEIVPGVTLREVFNIGWEPGFEGNLQIGRTPPLSSDKSQTHFPFLKDQTGIEYSGMLYFDDCNWGDHCSKVMNGCPGVVAVRTPNGLQRNEWEEGLATYAKKYGTIEVNS
jgi:magnesium-dependent phosphatase 1